MTNRKKRLKKGIDSIEKQIELHEEKREKAFDEGEIELAEYYEKELISKRKDKKLKEEQLEKN